MSGVVKIKGQRAVLQWILTVRSKYPFDDLFSDLLGTTHWDKMVCIRPAVIDDLLAMQRCNLLCLPENYQLKVQLCIAPANVVDKLQWVLGANVLGGV